MSEIEYAATAPKCRRGKAEEVTTVWAHLQDERPATGEDSDAGNRGGRSTSWTTCKKWPDDITDWCGCSLPEAVQLASEREKWRGVVGLNGHRGMSSEEEEYMFEKTG